MIKTGIDIVYIPRMKDIISKDCIANKLFTKGEIERFKQANNALETIAGTYAAKEAFIKAMQLGIGEVELQNIEIIHNDKGAPEILLYGDLKKKANGDITVSISHDQDYATAIVIIYQ